MSGFGTTPRLDCGEQAIAFPTREPAQLKKRLLFLKKKNPSVLEQACRKRKEIFRFALFRQISISLCDFSLPSVSRLEGALVRQRIAEAAPSHWPHYFSPLSLPLLSLSLSIEWKIVVFRAYPQCATPPNPGSQNQARYRTETCCSRQVAGWSTEYVRNLKGGGKICQKELQGCWEF